MSCWQRNGITVVPIVTGSVTNTAGSTINGRVSVSEINGVALAVDTEVTTWSGLINARIGGPQETTRSMFLQQSFVKALKSRSYASKIKYVINLIGTNSGMWPAFSPIIDTLGKGNAGFTGFDHPDFNQGSGIQGDGVGKLGDSLIKPSELGSSNNGGIGYWENNISDTGASSNRTASWNTDNTQIFGIALHSSYLGYFWWGTDPHGATAAGTGTNGHYYGQRSSATSRELFKNASSIATETTSDTASGAADRTIFFCGRNIGGGVSQASNTRCAFFYLTDGTLSTSDISDFHQLIIDYVFTPTGRPTS